MTNKRKQISLENKRNHVVVTKVTQGEYSKICSAAKSCNMTVSSFVRARCLGYKPKNKLSNEEIKLLGNLAKCLIREKVVTFRMVKLNLLLSIFLITK